MDKRPHYRQSGVVFSLLTGIPALLAATLLTNAHRLSYPIAVLTAVAIVYAAVSSVLIEKNDSTRFLGRFRVKPPSARLPKADA